MMLRNGNAKSCLCTLGQNNVKSANVMLSADLSRAVLIDFDSARPEGHVFGKFSKYGTFGF